MQQEAGYIHICLVSGQPMPNVLPWFDSRLRAKRVILFVTRDMESAVRNLVNLAQEENIQYQEIHIEDPMDPNGLYDCFKRYIQKQNIANNKNTHVLNATGGTKVMSIAAYKAFMDHGIDIFYINHSNNEVIWLNPDNKHNYTLDTALTTNQVLQVHGAEVTGKGKIEIDRKDIELADQIIRKYRCQMSCLHRIAGRAEQNKGKKEPKPVYLSQEDKSNNELMSILHAFSDYGKLAINGRKVTFPNEKARKFTHGQWLEQWVYDHVKRLEQDRNGIKDVQWNVNIIRQTRDGKKVGNELDVVFLYKNRLHIIECKAKKFGKKKPGANPNDALYKLDTLKELLGGLNARAMLVSYQDINDNTHQRAGDLNITICDGDKLKDFRDHLEKFIR